MTRQQPRTGQALARPETDIAARLDRDLDAA